ncbi:MAG: hypothetical protein K2M45_00530 [Muribaculaceae bacterium]|nr:hypothetical protein [Muribaculaceae bacterium]
MKKALLCFAAMAAACAMNAQEVYNYFDPADCDADGWLWFDTQEKIDKYVGFQGLGANPKIMLLSATFENDDMEYDEPFADPDIQGYNLEGVEGGEGSWTGAISLCGASTTYGSDAPNGGGFMLHLPSCAEFDLKLSTESSYMCLGLRGGAGEIEDVDAQVIQTYLRMGIFLQKQLTNKQQFTWENIQDVKNEALDNLHLQSESPVTAIVRNNMKAPLLVQAIKVMTYNDLSGIESVEADENAPVEFYNLQGMKVSGDDAGIYIRRQGSKTSKVIVK